MKSGTRLMCGAEPIALNGADWLEPVEAVSTGL